MIKNKEFVSKSVVYILGEQDVTPYYEDENVDALLRAYPNQTTHKMAVYMYMLGYINGKRAERRKRAAKQALNE